MSVENEIIEIINRDKNPLYPQKKAEKNLLVLLQKLTDENKKTLKPTILKLLKKYRNEILNSASHDKYKLASIVAFTILNYSEYKSHWGVDYDKILDWYCPSWFSQYYNNDQWLHIGYEKLLLYMKKGYLSPSDRKIAEELVGLPDTYNDFQEITLSKHIWTLFQNESEVHLTKRYPKFGKLEWSKKLVELANEKKIDRTKLLTECLLTSTRNFNKIAVGFFFDIFEKLKATNQELTTLQKHLFTVLQSQHSKPINQTLKYLKHIHKEPDFDIEGFMEQVPLLLSWNVKAVVNSTLSLLDALIKAYPDRKESLGKLALQALTQEDEGLQTRALKLLAKHKLLENRDILNEINPYTEGLYQSAKALLPNIREEHPPKESIETITPQYIREDNRIVYPKSLEEMVFFLSSILDKSAPYEYELFVELLPQVDKHLDADNAEIVAPAMQRAYKYYIKWGTSEIVYNHLHFIAACALLHYGWLLIKRVSDDFNSVKISDKLHKLFFDNFKTPRGADFSDIVQREYQENGQNLQAFHKLLVSLQAYTYRDIEPVDFYNLKKEASPLYLLKLRIREVLEAIERQKELRLSLSLPTHAPCSIEPKHFIERTVSSDELSDLQIQTALLRVEYDGLKEELAKLSDSEIKLLLAYLADKESFSLKKIEHPAWWLITILRKKDAVAFKRFAQHHKLSKNSLEQVLSTSFEVKQEPWEYETWVKGKKVTVTQITKKIRFEQSHFFMNLPFDTLFKSIYIQNKKHGDFPSLDAIYGLYLFSTVPEPYLSKLTQKAAEDWGSAQMVRALEQIMLYLVEAWRDFGPSAYLYVAYMMLYTCKPLRHLSAELWYKATLEGAMNQRLLGEMLGKLEHNEYTPLKQFTDLIVSHMLHLSDLHDQGLHTLLSSMIANMNDEPIKGTKKLLEIYLEVLHTTKLTMPDDTREKIVHWDETKSLKTIIKKVLKD